MTKTLSLLLIVLIPVISAAQTRLLRQPTISSSQVAFVYGGDIWTASKNGGEAKRITSTAATEASPVFSPDGNWIAFSSNRSGIAQVYVVAANGGTPTRLTWYPSASHPRGWSPDGKNILYASGRENAPTTYNRLWTVPVKGGPSRLLPAPWGVDGQVSPDGNRLAVDRMTRWDVEFRHYRGGQNTPLQILDLKTLKETEIPWQGSTDLHPVWMNNDIYFLSDRDFIMNVYAYSPSTGAVRQI